MVVGEVIICDMSDMTKKRADDDYGRGIYDGEGGCWWKIALEDKNNNWKVEEWKITKQTFDNKSITLKNIR